MTPKDLLSSHGAGLLEAGPSPELMDAYKKDLFLQVDDFIDESGLRGVLNRLLPEVRQHALRVSRPHKVSVGSLQGGRRLSRIDAGCRSRWVNGAAVPAAACSRCEPGPGGEAIPEGHTPEDVSIAVKQAFGRSGLLDFCDSLAEQAIPWIEKLTGVTLDYDRCFLLTYGEGDFIAPHGDTATSRRILLQMPVPFGCDSAMRVMHDGWMELRYDRPGCIRIMGPGMWHEVLPVQRRPGGPDPERVLLTLRLPFAEE